MAITSGFMLNKMAQQRQNIMICLEQKPNTAFEGSLASDDKGPMKISSSLL